MSFFRSICLPLAILASGLFLTNSVQAQTTEREVRAHTRSSDDSIFPLLLVGGNMDAFTRQGAVGGLLSADLTVDADWFLGGLRGSLGFMGNTSDGNLFTEISAYTHLLAIGVSDFTYRYYTDGHALRAFGGFSYTEHAGDTVRVDVNLGLAYFDEAQGDRTLNQIGFQLGTRIIANFWKIRNQFYVSAYQTVSFNDATIDLGGTQIVCDTEGVLAGEDLVCTVPESDGDGGGGGSILDWQSKGIILHNRLFLWAHETRTSKWGPEFEFRMEILPLRGTNFWVMLGVRAEWERF